MTTPRPDRSEFVAVDTSAARADRLWQGVRERLEPRPTRRWAALHPALVMAAVLVAFISGWLLARRPAESEWAKLESHAGSVSVQLQDGSRVTLDPNTALNVREQAEQRVELALELGRVELEVTPNPERVFSVAAAGYDVQVKGTRFIVDLSRERHELAIAVREGKVEVHRSLQPEPEATLGPGDRWSVPLESSAPAGTRAPALAAPPADAERAASVGEPVDAGRAAPASTAVTTPASPVAGRPTPSAPRAPSDRQARALFDRANAARRQGDLGQAARAYEQLLRQHPQDARAGLAALELGRLRMDDFQDAAGAVTALQLAVARASDPGLRADGLARLVRAFEILKDTERCQKARADYLQDYPTGAHVLSVARACGVK